jgi:hypothetical protein
MKETHPFLSLGKIPNASKLILGSFPIYSITLPENEEKERIRKSNGIIQFFYGSYRNSFWDLYRSNIDNNIQNPISPQNAINSLTKNKIAISDMIYKSFRKGRSASDSDLIDREYSIDLINQFLNNGITKILCTSKGVLEMFHNQVVKKNNHIVFQESETKEWQNKIILDINGNALHIKKIICKQYTYKDKIIRLLSMPSPGSPYRQIKHFGYYDGDRKNYTEKYFNYAFKWLINN